MDMLASIACGATMLLCPPPDIAAGGPHRAHNQRMLDAAGPVKPLDLADSEWHYRTYAGGATIALHGIEPVPAKPWAKRAWLFYTVRDDVAAPFYYRLMLIDFLCARGEILLRVRASSDRQGRFGYVDPANTRPHAVLDRGLRRNAFDAACHGEILPQVHRGSVDALFRKVR